MDEDWNNHWINFLQIHCYVSVNEYRWGLFNKYTNNFENEWNDYDADNKDFKKENVIDKLKI